MLATESRAVLFPGLRRQWSPPPKVSVSEWGFTIPMTEFEKNLSHFNIMDPFQQILRNQMSLTMDQAGAEAFKSTPVKYVAETTGGTFTTNGTPAGVSDRNVNVSDLRRIHDELSGVLKCPPFRNGKYVGILSTQGARGIKNDSEYKDWQAPTTSSPLITGVLKDIENFMLIETNHTSALANLAGTSTVCGEGVFFGADAAGLLQIFPPELRAGMTENLGRFREVGWVGEFDTFLTWEQPAQARCIHLSSL